jgi:hypothetical protein
VGTTLGRALRLVPTGRANAMQHALAPNSLKGILMRHVQPMISMSTLKVQPSIGDDQRSGRGDGDGEVRDG